MSVQHDGQLRRAWHFAFLAGQDWPQTTIDCAGRPPQAIAAAILDLVLDT